MDIYSDLKDTMCSEVEMGIGIAENLEPFHTTQTGTPAFDAMISNPEYTKTSQGLEGSVALMHPNQFLKIVAKAHRLPIDIETDLLEPRLYKRYAKMMKNGVKFDMPYIQYSRDAAGNLKVEHEGRHRAMAAKTLGLKRMPVFLVKPVGEDIDEIAKESSIDYPQQELCPDVWNKDEEGKYHLKPEVKEKILFTIKQYPSLNLETIADERHIIGSIGTNQYDEKTDIDVHLVIKDSSKLPGSKTPEEWQKDVSKWYRNNRSKIEGSVNGHPIEVFIQLDPDQEFMSDALYMFDEDRWEKGPLLREMSFDPYKAFEPIIATVKEVVGNTDKMLGELKRDVIDYNVIAKAVRNLPHEVKPKLQKELQNKLLKIEADIVNLMHNKKEWTDARKKSSSPTSREEALKDIDYAKRWKDANVLFKFLNRYEYMKLIAEMEKLMEDNVVDDVDIKVLNKLLGVMS